MEKPLYQSKAGLFDKLFHTYKWQIEKFKATRVEKQAAFVQKHKLNEKIELAGMDLEKWYFDPRLDVLLFMLANLPEYDCEHALSVLREKAPEIMAHIEAEEPSSRPMLEGPDRHVGILMEKKKDVAAALLLDVLCAQEKRMVEDQDETLKGYAERLRAIDRRDSQTFEESMANYDDDKKLGDRQTYEFYQKDVRGNRQVWQEEWVTSEFWRASAYHNIYMNAKTDLDAKRNASEAMGRFLTIYQRVYGHGHSPLKNNAEAISKLLEEEY